LGYQPSQGVLPVPTPYLRFAGRFDDQSEIGGYIDLTTWMNAVLPAVKGIDWLSVDDNLLPSLIADHPLNLILDTQHSPFAELRIVDYVRDTALLTSLPSLAASPGAVLIDHVSIGDVAGFPGLNANPTLSIPLSFVLGYSVLPVRALETVGVGDVMLVEHATGYVQSHHKRLFKFELNQESVMIGESLLNEESTASDTSKAFKSASANSEEGINALPIELSFVLFDKTVTLGELKALNPGEIMALPPDQLMDVEIRANQQRFASGELVQLPNGQFGVEIHKIWP